jgi:hypothetical protein
MIKTLIELGKRAFNWAKTIPSEPSGHGSSSRVIALIVTLTVAGLLIAFFKAKHELPSADQLYGMAAVLGTGMGGYVANRFRRNGDGDGDGGDPNAKS